MAGQSAYLSVKEAKAMQEKVQCGCNHSHDHGGNGTKKTSSGDSIHRMKKEKMEK